VKPPEIHGAITEAFFFLLGEVWVRAFSALETDELWAFSGGDKIQGRRDDARVFPGTGCGTGSEYD
jgi:hypothetical protein